VINEEFEVERRRGVSEMVRLLARRMGRLALSSCQRLHAHLYGLFASEMVGSQRKR
jgi:hypothetical protein